MNVKIPTNIWDVTLALTSPDSKSANGRASKRALPPFLSFADLLAEHEGAQLCRIYLAKGFGFQDHLGNQNVLFKNRLHLATWISTTF